MTMRIVAPQKGSLLISPFFIDNDTGALPQKHLQSTNAQHNEPYAYKHLYAPLKVPHPPQD